MTGKERILTALKFLPMFTFLASVLFFAGIASGFDWIPAQIAIIIIGFILLAWGLYNLATYPII